MAGGMIGFEKKRKVSNAKVSAFARVFSYLDNGWMPSCRQIQPTTDGLPPSSWK
jgi:hypothetical protein